MTIEEIEADFVAGLRGGVNFVIGLVGKIKAAIPVLEADLQTAAQIVYEAIPPALAAISDSEMVLSAAGLTVPPAVQTVTNDAVAVATAYQTNYTTGSIPESALVAAASALHTILAAPATAKAAAIAAPAAATPASS
jgi:hypothetical protein